MLSLDADLVKRVSQERRKIFNDCSFDLAGRTSTILRNLGSGTVDWCIEIFNLVWKCDWIDEFYYFSRT